MKKETIIKDISKSTTAAKTTKAKDVIKDGSDRIADMIMGNQNSEELARGAKKASEQALEISQKRMKFPELIANREERSAIIAKKIKPYFTKAFETARTILVSSGNCALKPLYRVSICGNTYIIITAKTAKTTINKNAG